MTEVRVCRHCGADLAGDTPEGLCPPCLLLREPPDSGPAEEQQASTGPYPGRAPAPSPAALGEHFPYLEILELLGQGGMGTVYKARQLKLDRLVALKILFSGPASGGTFADRFLREARALARLSHPHIVGVHDFGEAGALFYFVMEFVEGGSLRQFVRPGRLPPIQALSLVLQMCDALQYAHEEGIVHRDIKPENILLDRRGRIKIADFGLAKLLGPAPAAFTLTGSRQAMGTPYYMAPEQWEKAHAVDHRADIYSLGVVLYEMLAGELPLGRFALPSQMAAVDARLDDVVLRALEKDPERRYQQVAQLRADVEAVASRSHGPAPAVTPLPSTLSPGEMPHPAGTAIQTVGTGPGETKAEDPVLAAARRQIKGPATGLTWAGALSLLLQPLFVVWVGSMSRVSELTLALLNALAVVAMCFGIVTVLAARKMRQLEAPEFALIGSILAMVPLGPAWGLGLPMGIWALLVLRKPKVQAAFAAPKPTTGTSSLQWVRLLPSYWRRLLPRTTTAWAVLCCFLGACLALLPWAWSGNRRVSGTHIHGFHTWHGLAAALIFLVLAAALLACRRTWPAAVRRLTTLALKFLSLLVPLAGLAVVLFVLISMIALGVPGRFSEDALVHFGVYPFVGLLLIATVLLRRMSWRPVALILAGLAAVVPVGLFIHMVEIKKKDYLTSVPVPAGAARPAEPATPPNLWPVPFLVLACAAGLVVLGCFQLRRARRDSKDLAAGT